MKYKVPIHVRSSFSDAEGTVVSGEEGSLESVVVAGVASDKNEAQVTLIGVEDRPGIVALVFGALAADNVSVDMIIQNAARDPSGAVSRTDVTFTVAKTDLDRVRPILDRLVADVGASGVRYDDHVAKISIVGLGMRSHAGVAAKMFATLAAEGINIQAISTSEIKVSCLVAAKYSELAVRALHSAFNLAGSNSASNTGSNTGSSPAASS